MARRLIAAVAATALGTRDTLPSGVALRSSGCIESIVR